MSMPRQRQGETALQEVAKTGNGDIGADANAKAEAGETALHWSVNYGNAEVLRTG